MKTTNLFKAVAFVAMTIVSVMNTEVKAQENNLSLIHILADFLDYFACDERHVNVRFGFHFSSQHYLTGSNQSFAS